MILSLALSLAVAQEPNCADPKTQLDMNLCAERDFQQANVELNRIWLRVVAKARVSDRGLDRRYDKRSGYEQILRIAQRAWITYRDSHCTFVGYQEARGGSMEPLSYNICRATLTRDRVRQLANAEAAGS